MKIAFHDGLPFVSAVVHYRGKSAKSGRVLLDTGSAGSIFSVDLLRTIGVKPEPEDVLHRIAGVGGLEFVFEKRIDRLVVGDLALEPFAIEVGALNYAVPMDGIIGADFLRAAGAVLDLKRLVLKRG